MTLDPLAPTPPEERRRRSDRCRCLARRLGFVGRVLYIHTPTRSGGAQFVPGPAGDTLIVYAEAFRRDADPADYSLRAILAHERGHQVLARDPRLAGRAAGLPLVAEEVLASLVGARLVGPGPDSEALVAKAAADLLVVGMEPERAARLVGDLWGLLGELLGWATKHWRRCARDWLPRWPNRRERGCRRPAGRRWPRRWSGFWRGRLTGGSGRLRDPTRGVAKTIRHAGPGAPLNRRISGINMTPLERITERVSRHGDVNLPETTRPILPLSEFFDGNNVNGTIGCNLDPPPSSAQFHGLLKAILARPEVGDVRIVVTLFDDPAWPFSDTVWVITSATADEVRAWFDKAVRPTECWEGWYPDQPTEWVEVPVGMRIVTCQWD